MLQMEMLSFSASDPTSMIAKVIGSTFVARYYQLLPQQPELGYKFYKDSSFLRHPDSDGTMTTVTTLRVWVSFFFFIFFLLAASVLVLLGYLYLHSATFGLVVAPCFWLIHVYQQLIIHPVDCRSFGFKWFF